jgi:hypothetical protein
MSAVLLVTGTAAAAVAAIAAPASLSSIIVLECTTPAYCALVSVRSSGQRETKSGARFRCHAVVEW